MDNMDIIMDDLDRNSLHYKLCNTVWLLRVILYAVMPLAYIVIFMLMPFTTLVATAIIVGFYLFGYAINKVD